MIMGEEEYFFICPHCWQEVSVLLDTSVAQQTYIEDCEVCCHALEISYACEDRIVVSFAVRFAYG